MWNEEDINKKIKEAGDNYQPPYDSKAWDKMEMLLNNELPEKKKNEKYIYIFLLALLCAMGIYFVSLRKGNNVSPGLITTNVKHTPGKALAGIGGQSSQKEKTGASSYIMENTTEGKAHPSTASKDVHTTQDPKTENQRRSVTPFLQQNLKLNNGENKPGIVKNENIPVEDKQIETKKIPDELKKEQSAALPGKNNIEEMSPANQPAPLNDTATNNENEKMVALKDHKQEKSKKSFTQKFGIDFSVGPDISGVNLNMTGKVTPIYGAQVRYAVTNKLTLRTGLFVAKKIYSVDGTDYHSQATNPAYNYLESVSANCKVYEVPVTLLYSFGKHEKHKWFVSAGLSSYLMKKEAYEYYYKYPSGNTSNSSWAVTNKNKHYLSVLDISGGYQYFIDKHFSIIAEPYLKLPLSGIGLGKIKLNSTGILFTVSVKPF